MNDLEQRLVALDLLIARTKPMKDVQEKELRSAKNERKAIIVKLLKAQDAAAKT